MTSNHEPAAGAPSWRKSSYSNAGNQCVEIAQIDGAICVRDSKNPDGGYITFSAAGWREFLAGLKRGDFAP